MGVLDKLAKTGMVGGLAGALATNAGAKVDDLARNGYFGLLGLALAKKRRDPSDPRSMDEVYDPTGMNSGMGMKKGGKVKKMAKGGKVSSASKRGDGCAQRGKTKGRFC